MKITFDISAQTAAHANYALRKRYGLADNVRLDHVCKMAILQEIANELAKDAAEAIAKMNEAEQDAK
jgi:hypothetical protein